MIKLTTDNHQHNHNHKERKNVTIVFQELKDILEELNRWQSKVVIVLIFFFRLLQFRKALDNTAKLIFADHMENCLVDAVHQGNEQEVLEDIKKALDNFIR